MQDDMTLSEQLDNAINRYGDWDSYKVDYFLKLDPKAPANELAIFQHKMNEEARPTREFADHLARYREIADLNRFLRQSGR